MGKWLLSIGAAVGILLSVGGVAGLIIWAMVSHPAVVAYIFLVGMTAWLIGIIAFAIHERIR